MPDSTSPNQDPENLERQNARKVVNQSGGTNVDADQVSVGQDVVGRDKIESAGGHIIHTGPGSTVIIGGPIHDFVPPDQGLRTILGTLSPIWLLIAIICAALAVVLGGLLWNIVNVLFKWTFHLGGSGNEPYGIAAFIWGIILASITSSIALVAGYQYIPHDWQSLRRSLIVITLYTIGGGIGAVIFYDSGIRRLIESAHFSYGGQEVLVATAWTLVLSIFTYLPILVAFRISKKSVDVLHVGYLSLQIPAATILVLLAVLASLFIDRPESELSQLRGFFAGVALRLGLLLGFLFSIVMKWSLSLDAVSSKKAKE